MQTGDGLIIRHEQPSDYEDIAQVIQSAFENSP